MSRKPNNISKSTVQRLRQSVKEKSCLALESFSDVQQLHSYIKKETGEYLSVQTLNRLFGLIKNDYRPSAITLNILCKYLGYQSFAEFESMTTNLKLIREETDISSQMLLSLFKGMEVNGDHQEEGLVKLMKNLCLLVDKFSVMAKDIYPFFANSEFGRRYFFEQFVNIDALNGHYGDGLGYYVIHIKNREQKFFAHALLCQRYLLNCQYDLFRLHYEKVLEFSLDEVLKFHPFLVGRYYAVKVYAGVVNEKETDIIKEAKETFARLERNCSVYHSFPCAEYVLAEAMILAKKHYRAWDVLQSGALYIKNLPAEFEKGYINQYRLLQLYSGFYSGQVHEKKAREELKNINDKPLYFLSRQYFSFFIHKLSRDLMPKTCAKSSTIQIQNLIDNTGFSYLMKKLDSNSQDLYLMEIKGKKII
jgi:hypothetical protein